MWSDNDIDNAFQRLNPSEPEPTPFPLDAWLRLENELDKAVIERAVRRRLWKFFAAEVIVVALLVGGWLAWPTKAPRLAESASKSVAATTEAASAKVDQSASGKQLVPVGATTTTTATQSTTEGAANTLASVAAPKAALEASPLKAAPQSAAISAAPTLKHSASPATMGFAASAAGGPDKHRQRTTAESRLAFQGSVIPQKAHLFNGRRGAAIRPERTVTTTTSTAASAVEGAARLHNSSSSVIAQNADPHSAAGSLAAPTEASAEAVVADAASQRQLRRESQSPLLDKAAIRPATPSNEASATDASDASASTSATADAALAPNAIRPPVMVPAALPAPLASVVEAPANLPAVVRQPRFYIGLVAAPDVTTVKFVDVERPMLNLGVVLEYRLTNRLRVSTGLLRAKKQYYARREDYDWTDYPRAQTRNFSWVDGACTVVDVPLNLRYDAVVRPQARLFGSVGLSSFFMQRENYSYDYLEDGSYKTWNIPGLVNENRHLFSVLNLSVGYEHQLGTHWRLQAEPYVKLPLAGVGAGKVQLTSGGVFFGVKYGF